MVGNAVTGALYWFEKCGVPNDEMLIINLIVIQIYIKNWHKKDKLNHRKEILKQLLIRKRF